MKRLTDLSKIPVLKVEEKFLELILDGQKDWELRRVPTSHRGLIGLGNMRFQNVEGYVSIIGQAKYPVEFLRQCGYHHRATEFLSEYAGNKTGLWAYFLKDPVREPVPMKYSFSTVPWSWAWRKNVGEI